MPPEIPEFQDDPIPEKAPPNESLQARIDRIRRLSDKARALPRVPGVYLMKDAAGKVLYIGKLARLGAFRIQRTPEPSYRGE